MRNGNDTRGRRPGPPDRPRPGAGSGRGAKPGPRALGGKPNRTRDGAEMTWADRPARPAGGGALRERPAEARPAPLPDLRDGPADAPAHERIAKVMARAGVASRRDAEAMIAEGRVTLNGETLSSPAQNVGPDDAITVDGEPLPLRERTRLWLFHKPRGLVTTFRDPEGRPTVFEALPEDMPRVVAIGRLDINTEGLLLLTNDGGLAKVIAQPATGWTRRYRVRAHGDVDQARLDRLKNGITIEGIEYGPIDAILDRVQGDNIWLSLALREGKNREVKRVLEHIGIQVNRLIRLSFGPFQLGDLEQGLVEEVRTRVLKDQLGAALAEEAGVDFESPVREPISPFGKPDAAARAERPPGRGPRARSAAPEPTFKGRGFRPDPVGAAERPGRTGPARERSDGAAERARDDGKTKRRPVWRADESAENAAAPRKLRARREDPRADRAASAERQRERVGKIAAPEGRQVLVERLVSRPAEDVRPRKRGGGSDEGPPRGRAGPPRARPGGEPARSPRPGRAADGPQRPGRPFREGSRPGRDGSGDGRPGRGPGRPGPSRGDKGGPRGGGPGSGRGPGGRGAPGGAPKGRFR